MAGSGTRNFDSFSTLTTELSLDADKCELLVNTDSDSISFDLYQKGNSANNFRAIITYNPNENPTYTYTPATTQKKFKDGTRETYEIVQLEQLEQIYKISSHLASDATTENKLEAITKYQQAIQQLQEQLRTKIQQQLDKNQTAIDEYFSAPEANTPDALAKWKHQYPQTAKHDKTVLELQNLLQKQNKTLSDCINITQYPAKPDNLKKNQAQDDDKRYQLLNSKHQENKQKLAEYLSNPLSPAILDVILKLDINHGLVDDTELQVYFTEDSDGHIQINLFGNNAPYPHISTITCISNGDGSFRYNTAPIYPAPVLPLDDEDNPLAPAMTFKNLQSHLEENEILLGLEKRCANAPDSLESFQAIANYDSIKAQQLVDFSNGRCDKKLHKKLKTALKSNIETRIDYLARESAVSALDKEITQLFSDKIQDDSLRAQISGDRKTTQLFGKLRGKDELVHIGKITATHDDSYKYISYQLETITDAATTPEEGIDQFDQAGTIEKLTAFELVKNFASKCVRTPKDLRDFQYIFNYAQQTQHWPQKNNSRHNMNLRRRKIYLAKHSAIDLLKQELEAKTGLNGLDNVVVQVEHIDAQSMRVSLYAKDGEKKHLQDIVWKIDSDGHIGYDLFEADKTGTEKIAPESAAAFNPIEMLAGIENIYSFKEKTQRFIEARNPERPTQQKIKEVVEYRQTTHQFFTRHQNHLPAQQFEALKAAHETRADNRNTLLKNQFLFRYKRLEAFKEYLASQKVDLSKCDAIINRNEANDGFAVTLYTKDSPRYLIGTIYSQATLPRYVYRPHTSTQAVAQDDGNNKPQALDIMDLLESHEVIAGFKKRFPKGLVLTRFEDIQALAEYENIYNAYRSSDAYKALPHGYADTPPADDSPEDTLPTPGILSGIHEANTTRRRELLSNQLNTAHFLLTDPPDIKPEDRQKLLAELYHDQKVKANIPTGQAVDSSKLKLPGVALPEGFRVLAKPGDGGSEPSYILLNTDAGHTADVWEFTETQHVHLNTQSPDEGKDADEERPVGSTIAWHDKDAGVNYCLLPGTPEQRAVFEESKEEDPQQGEEVRYTCYQLKDNEAHWRILDSNGQPVTTVVDGKAVPSPVNKDLRESLLAETRQTLKRPLSELLLIGQYGNCHAANRKINELDRDYVIMELAADPGNNIPQRYLVLHKQVTGNSHTYQAVALLQQASKEGDDDQQLYQFIAANYEQIEAYEKQTKQKLTPEKDVIDNNAQRFSQYLTFHASSPIIHTNPLENEPSQLLHNPFVSIGDQNQEEYRRNSVTIAIKQFESDKRLIDEAMLMCIQCRSDHNKPKLESQNGGKLYRILGERVRSLESTLKTIASSNPGPTEPEGTKAASYKEMAALCNELKSTQQELGEVIKNHKEYFVTQDELIKQDFSTGSFRTQVVSQPTTKSCYARGGFAYTIHYSDESRNEIKKIKIDSNQRNKDPILHAIALAEICDTSRKVAPGLSFAWESTSDRSLLIEEIVNYLENGRPMSEPFRVTHADLHKIIVALNPLNRSDTDYTSSVQLAAAGSIRQTLTDLNTRCLFDLAWGNPMIAQCLKQYAISNPNTLNPDARTAVTTPGRMWGTRTAQTELTINALDIIKQQQRQLVRSAAKLAGKEETVQSSFGFSKTEGKTPVAGRHHLRTYAQQPGERPGDSIISSGAANYLTRRH